jgi:hypothetical protein
MTPVVKGRVNGVATIGLKKPGFGGTRDPCPNMLGIDLTGTGGPSASIINDADGLNARSALR